MYRKLLASTALSLVIAGGAYAQEMAPADPAAAPMDPAASAPADPAAAAPAETPEQPLVNAEETGINADGWLATEIIGETIYNSAGDDAEAIGDVNDFVLDQNGEIGAVVVGVGGFLGIGQKSVAINWDELELTQDMDGNNRLVANRTREQLENAQEFNREEWLASEAQRAQEMDAMNAGDGTMAPAGDAMAPAAPAGDAMAPAADEPVDDTMATEEAPADDAMATDAEPAADDMTAEDEPMVPADDAAAEGDMTTEGDVVVEDNMAAEGEMAAPAWDGMEAVQAGDISADELTGTAVYGAGDENIGSIGDIILSEDGAVQAVIVDFGGFLGIGTKPVAVDFENLSFVRDENGSLLLRTSLTAEQLEAAPEYEEEAYLQAPADNSLIIE